MYWGLVALVVAAVGVAAVAVVLLAAPESRVDVTDLEIGDCFVLDAEDDGEVDPVEVVACTSPHDAEVVGTTDLNPSGELPYPDDDALFALADTYCAELERDPAFAVLAIAPTAATWAGRAGRSLCVAVAYGDVLVTVPVDAVSGPTT